MLTHRAAADFYAQFSGLVRRIVNRRLGTDPDASDVVQEAFTQIFRSLHQLENPEQIEHWVARVTAHTIYKELRHRRRRVRLLPAEYAESALARFGYDHDWEGRELLQRTANVLEQLSPEQGGLLRQRLFECLTLEELAEQAGWSQSMLKRRLQRARTRFERLAARDVLLKSRVFVSSEQGR
ncbi:MAG TPA: sigma-70 family RNA polymerase sigma factor [Polyangiaceae bacterium]|nr:sigma-70 family RNA polymerase sigma factor [Polyangiaceae bacterium]